MRPFLQLTAAIAASACVGDSSGGLDVTVTDSAGIQLVTNHVDPSALPVWSLGRRSVDIGVIEGDPAYQLFGVMDGVRLEDARIVVVNAGTRELRFYDETGAFLESVGREGDGPGEYRLPFRIYRMPEDSLLVYDYGLARFTVLDPDGGVGRVFGTGAALNEPEIAGLIGDSILVTHEVIFSILSVGFDTMRARVRFFDTEGRGSDSLVVPTRRMGRMGGARGSVVGSPPFEPTTLFVAGDEGLWMGSARSAELRLFGPDRVLRRIVRYPWTARRVTGADVEAFVDDRVAESDPDEEPLVRSMFEGTPVPEVFPAYTDLHLDSSGRLWILDPAARSDAAVTSWLVFAPGGRLVARAELTDGLRVLEMGDDYVLAATTDRLEVEHVVLWELEKSSEER